MSLLSKNFTRKEFRCRGNSCCGNSAPISLELVKALQELRDLIDKPLKIRSGFRCNVHNRRDVGSKDSSQHTLGLAADVELPKGWSVDDFVLAAEMIDVFREGGIGRYPEKGFVHLDIRTTGPARWEGE